MIRFSVGITVETLAVSEKTEYLDGARHSVATITTTGIDYALAAELFADGAVWSIVEDGQTYDVWNAYTKAGPITDNRDGTVVVKMGMADTAEQKAMKEAERANSRLSLLAGISVKTDKDVASVRANVEMLFQKADMDNDARIANRNLCAKWKPGNHNLDEIYCTDQDSIWKCRQSYDNDVFPDIKPGTETWFTFNIPLHGATPETALPFVPPKEAESRYKSGEYMVWTDGSIQHCVRDTAYGPDEDATAWEVYDG